MKIVVPVKRVPDTADEKTLDDSDGTVERDSNQAVLCPSNEFALEEAMRLKESASAEVVALMVGPETAQPILRKALAFGLDAGVQVVDDAIAGVDALGTARVVAAALARLDWDLVIFGSQSTDARTSLVPAAVAEILGLPCLSYARYLEVANGRITLHREHEDGWDVVVSALPAIVSVVEAINEPRYPSLKSALAARSKPLDVIDLTDLGLDSAILESAARICGWKPREGRARGHVVFDDESGQAARELVDWLSTMQLLPTGTGPSGSKQ